MIITLARKINLFNRDRSKLSISDVTLTYTFIVTTIYLISWFSVKYYNKGSDNINNCKDSNFECVKTETIHLIVPFTGIVYGFIASAYKGCDLLASGINYFCCCFYCCCSVKDNENEITLDLNQSGSVRV
jgi:hypothetical protein